MEINVRGENLEITEALKEYAVKKLDKLERIINKRDGQFIRANVNLIMYPNNKYKAEVTLYIDNIVLRGEKETNDIKSSIDAVEKRLYAQINKYKTKINQHNKNIGFADVELKRVTSEIDDLELAEQEEISSDQEFDVVRTKQLQLEPMDVQNAILQMEMLGHNFYLFQDSETNENSLVYQRNDGRYGLIEIDN